MSGPRSTRSAAAAWVYGFVVLSHDFGDDLGNDPARLASRRQGFQRWPAAVSTTATVSPDDR